MKISYINGKKRSVSKALVLSGGGAKGAYQLGVVKELLERGESFDIIIGSSIGAFNAILLAEFYLKRSDWLEAVNCLIDVWMEVNNFILFNWQGFISNFFTLLNIPSIFSNYEIKRVLNKYIPDIRKFSDYKLCQVSVTATNLNRKKIKIFDYNSKVDVKKAVLASMAYPVAFPAININNNFYIDGGALNNAPLKEALLWGAKRIYLIFLTPLSVIEGGEGKDEEDDSYSALEVIDSFIELTSNKMMYGDFKNAEKINKLISILNKFQGNLPEDFLKDINNLFGLKKGDGKNIVKIIKFAPENILKPPGTIGFNKNEILRELIIKGQKDAKKILNNF